MSRFSLILKRLREERDITQEKLAKAIGMKRSRLSMYELGEREPDFDALKAFANYFNVPVGVLLGENEDYDNMIPVLGDVAAGIPIEATEDIIDYVVISPSMFRTGDFFGLRLKGDSMSPRLNDGDIVIVRKQETVDNNELAVVMVGDSATVKVVKFDRKGISLIPFNPDFAPMRYTKEDVEQKPITILGKVVEARLRF